MDTVNLKAKFEVRSFTLSEIIGGTGKGQTDIGFLQTCNNKSASFSEHFLRASCKNHS